MKIFVWIYLWKILRKGPCCSPTQAVLSSVSGLRQWHPTPVLLPGKSHGWSLVGCSPWGREESDTTEWLHFHFSLSCIGEGNGNPLQCSCLEDPRDGGAWWAAIYAVAQSWTWLKRLSSSSSPIELASCSLVVPGGHRLGIVLHFVFLSPFLPFPIQVLLWFLCATLIQYIFMQQKYN